MDLGENFEAEMALVGVDDVVTLTEVFDAVKGTLSAKEIREVVRDEMERANRTRRKA